MHKKMINQGRYSGQLSAKTEYKFLNIEEKMHKAGLLQNNGRQSEM